MRARDLDLQELLQFDPDAEAIAAVVGVVLNLAVWFALHTLFGEVQRVDAGAVRLLLPVPATIDWGALMVSAASVLAVFRWRIGMLPLLGGATLAGVLLHEVGS